MSIKFAILAAGEGSRLAAEGVATPKPFVEVGGRALIDRLLDIYRTYEPAKVVVITNDAVFDYMKREHPHWEEQQRRSGFNDFQLLVKSTPSSMHSFYELMPLLGSGPFILSTVDTIFREEEFRRYVDAFCNTVEGGQGVDGMMAVTDFVDDEKPLWVSTDEALRITGFHDSQEHFKASGAAGVCRYVSGGVYGLAESCFPTLVRCIENGQSRMRNFQRALVADGLTLQAYPFTKILDVDHVRDVEEAKKSLTPNPSPVGEGRSLTPNPSPVGEGSG